MAVDLALAGRPANHHPPVRLGVGLSFDEHGTPHLTFERQEFSVSEAASDSEYTRDVAIRAQRG
jgi:hypothetical protein